MSTSLIYQLLDTSSFKLTLNEELPKFKLISELLTHNNISFETWNPDDKVSLDTIEMSFSTSCKFQDVYLLSYLLKDFGLVSIYPSRKKDPEIYLGTNLIGEVNVAEHAIAEPINVFDFLKIDPKLNTLLVVDTFFENRFSDDELEEKLEDDDFYEQSFDIEFGPYDYDGDIPDYDDEPAFDGYESWDDMAFYEAFGGDIDAWNHYNQ